MAARCEHDGVVSVRLRRPEESMRAATRATDSIVCCSFSRSQARNAARLPDPCAAGVPHLIRFSGVLERLGRSVGHGRHYIFHLR